MRERQADSRFAAMARKAREASGLAQGTVAQAMTDRGYEWRQQTVTRFEVGKRPATVGEAAALAALLGLKVSLTDLGSGDLCAVCDGNPPTGFTCNECGRMAS